MFSLLLTFHSLLMLGWEGAEERKSASQETQQLFHP